MNLLSISCSHEILEHVKDLIEFDYVVMKVLLFMCPHKELGTVLQNADPILCTSFYIWYVQNYGRDYIAKAKDHEVTNFCYTCMFC